MAPEPEPEPRRRERRYDLFGHSIVLCEGDCDLAHTGWKTWGSSLLLAKHLERRWAAAAPEPTSLRILDLSCGTGLAGVALAKAGHDVVLCDLEVNVPTICSNLRRNAITPNADKDCLEKEETAKKGQEESTEAKGEEKAAPVWKASVVGYNWGRALPEVMRRPFDIILCGDLLYHVWTSRLQDQFMATLSALCRSSGGQVRTEILFAFQVRSSRQEGQILSTASARLSLNTEEFSADEVACAAAAGSGNDDAAAAREILRDGRYRLLRLCSGGAAGAAGLASAGEMVVN
eukprot:TRINITY_DN6447_c1_g1_i1.p1 TRINITY_DN6447_c1_g1~~TRINITY_DN6447_c1_g1_i1.p1  ORF type:complete len:290 (-),score=63.23 TRINITY_DN6447_c1_g1_i1:444-1313(-)